MEALLILIILIIIISAVVGAGAAAAMRPKAQPKELEPAKPRTRHPEEAPRSTRKPQGPPSECTYCGYAIEPHDHYVRCANCGEGYHDDCAHSLEGYCSKCNGPLY